MNQDKQYIRIGGSHRRRRQITFQGNKVQAQLNDYRAIAYCTKEVIPLILPYDHHIVEVQGKKGLLYTFHLSLEMSADQNLVVVFGHLMYYPSAPEEIQHVLNQLEWKI